MNQTRLFNEGWEFAKSALEEVNTDSLKFESIEIPHDWLIYDTLNLYEDSIGWYRKRFYYERKNHDENILLYFGAIYMNSTVYVNEKYVGEWKYGYSSFEYDITKQLKEGENEILIKVLFQSPNSRWYSGAGIYRDVWLKTRGENYIPSDGIYISTKQGEVEWEVEIETDLQLHKGSYVLLHELLWQEEVIASSSESLINGPSLHNKQNIKVKTPLLWDVEKPHLYQIRTKLICSGSGELIEMVEQNIGFKTVELDPNNGFHLNGKKIKLNGVCEHHDLGALGAAFNKNALRRRFLLLKQMGVNAIRTAHNMPSKEWMELADEMGFLMVTEAFDMWERSKTKYDYGRFFKEWFAGDIKSWVMRDRNHVSLIMWSIGNEIYDTHADERGLELTKILIDEVKKYDPKGNGYVTLGSNYMPWENAQKCADVVKVVGYNYAEKYYEQHHLENPDWIIYGSETSSIVQSRGIYHFPLENSILADDDEQCSALGNSSTSWGAKSVEFCIMAERNTPYSLGQFLWTGFDYIGEPTPYHTKNSYFGQIDTATFPKDSYYIYQAAWTDYKKKPMIHIFPYWDFNNGQIIDVRVCSNAPKIELFLNERSLGVHQIQKGIESELLGHWKIPYEPGELKALAYDEDGKVIASDIKKSFGDAASIHLKSDKNQLISDGEDLLFLEISMKDSNGNTVENANNRVEVNVSGAGRLIGLDNGDSTDYDQYKGISRRLFSGKLMAIIASKLESGPIHIKVSSTRMETRVLEIPVLEVATTEKENALSILSANTHLPIVMGNEKEVPLRKIELISELGCTLNQEQPITEVSVKLHPENTSYREVEWSVVNDVGIESKLAKLETKGLNAILKAMGDGDFRLRCTSKNGTAKTKLISELEFKVEGIGTTYKNPYQLISAGLYDFSQGEVSNGNERGVATSRDGETIVGFNEINFGEYGSNKITLPIFALTNEEYPIQIWRGVPGENDTELLADVIYQKESKWNVYQKETYKLSKRLIGLNSIYFVLNKKVHIKGFSFEKQDRTLAENKAIEHDEIYGDYYYVKEETVEEIGNNVSLVFHHFDFTNKEVRKIAITGRAPIDNTIHLYFKGETGEDHRIVEFSKTSDYKRKIFDLQELTGKQQVTFAFLPGSHFDFDSFQFLQ
ncbi:glycoside hydrolase family 2 TIM barrel-domain containing protein [Alkalihalobacillus trypoxylicola]|uniref:Glycoside hydrolase n=1 Tax=Alkalihalobacillus trypoxylicola TaxID=519424 RepID=A0A161PEG4_9BACI|nr:glycoside hydrolase family 2 TIM barrel-domain containing protein [Alkalihalobacillus trypoxylicola]KYG26700.1 glycoside hydrolase [Alkalihalobacillus trypoxylicola]